VRAEPARRDTLAAPIEPEGNAFKAVDAIPSARAQPVLAAIGEAAVITDLADGRRAGAHAVETRFRRVHVGIESTSALVGSVSIDVFASRRDVFAIGLVAAALMHAPAERGRVEPVAEVTLWTVHVQNAGNAAVDTAAAFAVEPDDAIGVGAASGRRLDAPLALIRNLDALALYATVRGGLAGTAPDEQAVTDRRTLEGVASRLDTREAIRAVLTRVADGVGGTREAKCAGHARGLGATCPTNTARAGVTTEWTARSAVFATK
jgi:hypothetical protein